MDINKKPCKTTVSRVGFFRSLPYAIASVFDFPD